MRSRWRWLPVVMLSLLATVALSASVMAQGGSIGAHSIQIDGNANLYAADTTGGVLNTGADLDWVATTTGFTGTGCLQNSVASCNEPNVTAAVGGQGTWNGVRIVDGIAGNDQDIFLTGGKENDTTTWNVGPGSIGSSKYDAIQGYLANNQQNIYFGMERRGNNGSTAFDFEFNQVGTAGGYIPVRTIGDILFTYEMISSGGGSVDRHIFYWNGSQYCEFGIPASGGCAFRALPGGLYSSINTDTSRATGPWGSVDSHGNWYIGNLDRFTFGEAVAPVSVLNLTGCAGSAFVQLRTRSSATATSDLKDATKIFEYKFGGPTANATLSANCSSQFTFDGSTSTNSSGGTTGLTYSWVFTPAVGVSLSGTGINGPYAGNVYTSSLMTGTVNVTFPAADASTTIPAQLTVSESGCDNASTPLSIVVYHPLAATATLTPQCGGVIDYASTASGGKGPYTYSWTLYNSSNTAVKTSTSASGTFTGLADGAYHAVLVVTDTADSSTGGKPVCQVTANSNTVSVYSAVSGTASLTPGCDLTFGYSASGSGGLAPYSYSWTFQKNSLDDGSGTWTTVGTSSTQTGTFDASAFGGGKYRALLTIQDSQGIVCVFNTTLAAIDVRPALTASASKTGADGTALTVTLTGTSNGSASDLQAPASFQWQRFNGTTWVNISGATSLTLNYATFESDATASPVTFTIGADSYVGDVYAVQLRLHVQRTVNGNICQTDSTAVTVKKVIAVDP